MSGSLKAIKKSSYSGKREGKLPSRRTRVRGSSTVSTAMLMRVLRLILRSAVMMSVKGR